MQARNGLVKGAMSRCLYTPLVLKLSNLNATSRKVNLIPEKKRRKKLFFSPLLCTYHIMRMRLGIKVELPLL